MKSNEVCKNANNYITITFEVNTFQDFNYRKKLKKTSKRKLSTGKCTEVDAHACFEAS